VAETPTPMTSAQYALVRAHSGLEHADFAKAIGLGFHDSTTNSLRVLSCRLETGARSISPVVAGKVRQFARALT